VIGHAQVLAAFQEFGEICLVCMLVIEKAGYEFQGFDAEFIHRPARKIHIGHLPCEQFRGEGELRQGDVEGKWPAVCVAAFTKPGSAEASPMPATARVLCWMNWRLLDMGEVVYL
jgi:hypothetical protein